MEGKLFELVVQVLLLWLRRVALIKQVYLNRFALQVVVAVRPDDFFDTFIWFNLAIEVIFSPRRSAKRGGHVTLLFYLLNVAQRRLFNCKHSLHVFTLEAFLRCGLRVEILLELPQLLAVVGMKVDVLTR